MLIGLYGFGAINRLVAAEAVRRGHEIIGAVDVRVDLIGRDIGEIIGIGEYGVRVSNKPEDLLEADVVIHATTSYLDKAYDQLLALARMGLDTVSTCESLAYPYYRYPILARWLERELVEHGATMIGTGINPGFLLDTLPIILTLPFNEVKSIKAIRSVDASKRRKSFQEKIGLGLTPEVFKEKVRRGELTGHVGYAESVLLIAEAARLRLTRVEEEQEPLIGSSGEDGEKGIVYGIQGHGRGYIGDKLVVNIEFRAGKGLEEYEEIIIEGRSYTVKWRSTGTPGDMGTVAVLLNIAESIDRYSAGLLTMVDLLPFKPRIRP